MKYLVRVDFRGEGYATRIVSVTAESEEQAKELAIAQYVQRISATIIEQEPSFAFEPAVEP